MRLAYLSTDPGISFGGAKGAAVHLGEIVAGLSAEGVEVLVLVSAIEPGTTVPAGINVEVLPGPGKSASAAERVAYQPALAEWLTGRLQRFSVDVLYERLALYADGGSVVARRLGVPHIVELNAPLLDEAARFRTLDDPGAAERLESSTLGGADLVLAVSPPLAEYAAARGARRVEVMQNGAAIERFAPRTQWSDDPVAVFAGTLRPWHGIETIAAAWRLLGASAPPLLVVGDGPSRELLEGLPARFTGHVPPQSVPALLATAEIGLAPYGPNTPRYFSPIKLFEYLAAGLATVVADLPATRAIVGPDSAVLVPAGDAEALAASVADLCHDRQMRERLGRNGRALVEGAHTWRHRARRILELATELAEQGELTPVEARA